MTGSALVQFITQTEYQRQASYTCLRGVTPFRFIITLVGEGDCNQCLYTLKPDLRLPFLDEPQEE